MIKKILPWFVFSSLIILMIIGYGLKDCINNNLSIMMKNQVGQNAAQEGLATLDSLYNYLKNGQSYDLTFLEVGAKGCTACKKMEKVMQQVKETYSVKVNVVFLNVLEPEGQQLMKVLGVAMIPTQILLDKQGKEFYRHTGYIPFNELSTQFH